MDESQSLDAITSGLNHFGGNLTGLLQLVATHIHKLQKSHDSLSELVGNLESDLQSTTQELAYLRTEAAEQKQKLEEFTSSVILVNAMGKSTTDPQTPGVIDMTQRSESKLVSDISMHGSFSLNHVPTPKTAVETKEEGNDTESLQQHVNVMKEETPKFKENSIANIESDYSNLISPSSFVMNSFPASSATSAVNSPSGKRVDPSKSKSVKPKPPKEYSLKFQLGKALSDAVQKYSKDRLVQTSARSSDSPVSDERIQRLERALLIQDGINKISAAIVKSNNDTSLSEMEVLQMQIKKLESDLLLSKSENDSLRASISDVYAKLITFTNSRNPTPKLSNLPLSTSSRKSTARFPVTPQPQLEHTSSPLMLSPSSALFPSRGAIEVNVETGSNEAVQIEDSLDVIHENVESKQESQIINIPVLDKDTIEKVDATHDMAISLDKTTKKLSLAVESISSQVEDIRELMNRLKAERNGNSDSDLSPRGSVISESKNLISRVSRLNEKWGKVFTDLKYGLLRNAVEKGQTLNFPNIIDSNTTGTREASVVHKAEDFINSLSFSLKQLEKVDGFITLDEMTSLVLPVLDQVTLAAEDLIATEDLLKPSVLSTNDISLNDMYCEDGTVGVRERIEEVLKASGEVLEDIDDKIFLKRRLDKLDKILMKKAEFSSLKNTETDLKRLIASKLERQDLIQALEKKASISDLDKLKEHLYRNLQAISDNQKEDMANTTLGPLPPETPANEDRSSLPVTKLLPFQNYHQTNLSSTFKDAVSKDISDLNNRFEFLHRHFKDLESFCDTFVPRTEVEEAMHALFAEVKAMKNGSVSHHMLKEGLRLKADAVDLERLVQSLTSAVGELNGLGEASALHSKCLVCDKPVSSLARVRYNNQVGYDKHDDGPENESIRPQTGKSLATIERHGSPSKTLPTKDKVKVAADITVLKSTIDLPPINDNTSSKYHQRIRMSAGGGMGQWTMDSR